MNSQHSAESPEKVDDKEPLVFDVQELDCADCAAHFEEAVRLLDGVQDAKVNFAAAILTVIPKAGADGLVPRIAKLAEQMGNPVILRAPTAAATSVTAPEGGDLVYDVAELDCADCAAHFGEAVRALPGVRSAALNFAAAVLTVTPDAMDAAERQKLHEAIAKLGQDMGNPVTLRGQPQVVLQAPLKFSWWARLAQNRRNLLTAIAAVLIAAGFAAQLLGVTAWVPTLLFALATVVGGYYVARAGWTGLRATRSLDMNALMTIAVIGAMVLGQWAEGAMVVFLFSLGNALEGYTMGRARNAIRALISLAPKTATLLDGEQQREVPVEALAVGDKILVRADQRIPMDGLVESGQSAVNQAPVTGESVPVDKAAGDEVFAGTVNGEGSLVVRVTRLAQDNTIARIIRMVEEAQARKAPSQRFVDRFARAYTPAVIAGAFVVAFLPPMLGLGTLTAWVYRALVLLVISCPCALVISTPVSIVSAIATAARLGVLVKGGAYLEELGTLKVIAFDKTGTLTQGIPQVVGGTCDAHLGEDGAPDQCPVYLDLLAQAAAVEAQSLHPLAKAVVAQAERAGVRQPGVIAENVQTTTGGGIRGTVNGHRIAVGSHTFIHEAEEAPACSEFCELLQQRAGAGETTMVMADLCCDRRALLTVADQLRPDAAKVLSDLKAAGILKTVMLTGDNAATAQKIAEQVGIDEFRAELKPEDKVEAITKLLGAHGKVAMVGDGVNDAPALAQATVGIAMGAMGSEAALETADVALMGDDLTKLAPTIKLSQRTLGTIKQNIIISLIVKVVFLTLAVLGAATLWMAVFADVGTSMIVILNGMRLLRLRASETSIARNPEAAAS